MVSRTGYPWPKLVLPPQVMGDTPTVCDKRAMGRNPALYKRGGEEEERFSARANFVASGSVCVSYVSSLQAAGLSCSEVW